MIRWAKRRRETGSFEAKSNEGQSRSPLKKHEGWLLALVRQEPNLTLEEIQRRLLEERQQKAGLGSVWRFFDRHGISFKKSVRAAEQDRPDVAAARMAWADDQPKLDPDRLVFIDETGTSTKMARLRGRAPRGERLVGKIPHRHWKTNTFVAALRSTALTAPCVIDGPMNGNGRDLRAARRADVRFRFFGLSQTWPRSACAHPPCGSLDDRNQQNKRIRCGNVS